MKIHFMALVDGDQENYKKITNHIEKMGHTLVTDHYLKQKISNIKDETSEESSQYRKNREKWLRKADVVLFEGTKQDINLGIEMAEAISLYKPVILFYKEKVSSIPYSLKAENRTKVIIVEYNDSNMKQQLEFSIELANEELDVRFNLMLPSNLLSYLNSKSEQQSISKAAYIRNLINKDKQEKNNE